MVKTLLRRCVRCLKLTGMSYKSPDTPQLPEFRLTEGPLFTACGVDFTGTLYYKAASIPNKAYIIMFVYMCRDPSSSFGGRWRLKHTDISSRIPSLRCKTFYTATSHLGQWIHVHRWSQADSRFV